MTTQDVIREPARDLPVHTRCDVAVVGGGIAGVAAAVAAARSGVSVCLLEKGFGLGGLATLGNVIVYLPLCDGLGRQVTGGIAEELLRLSVQFETNAVPSMRVDADIPRCWRESSSREERVARRFRVCFNPTRYMMALERWVLQQGVDVMYDTRFCTVVRDGDSRITALVVENKDGRGAVACRAVVDATGDADVCAASDEPVVSLHSNVRCGWFYYLEDGQVTLNCMTKPYARDGSTHPDAGPVYGGDVAADVTAQVLASRELIWDFLQSRGEASEGVVTPLLIPTLPCMRMTRRLRGVLELTAEDQGQWHDDTVAMVGDWRAPGPAYCIPYWALTAVNTPNLITAGRCISAVGSAWDMARAIPVCAATGDAAGTAAGLVARRQTPPDYGDIRPAVLQKRLVDHGVILDRDLLAC